MARRWRAVAPRAGLWRGAGLRARATRAARDPGRSDHAIWRRRARPGRSGARAREPRGLERRRRRRGRGMRVQLRAAALGLGACVALAAWPSRGQVAEVDMRTQVFHEPSASSQMTVYTPEVNVSATPAEGWRVSANYQADVVTGASEAVKAGPLLAGTPDIVSRAS